MELHYSTVFESVADAIGDDLAIVQGDVRRSWADFDERAARFAAALLGVGAGPGSKVGQLLYNGPEFLETYHGTLKIRAIPFNINFRYTAEEILYLLDNADAEALVYHSSLADVVAEVIERGPKLRLVVEVDDGGRHVHGSVPIEVLLDAHSPAARVERSADDLTMLYTGGTTGMPKGVLSPIGPPLDNLLKVMPGLMGQPALAGPSEVAAFAARMRAEEPPLVALPTPPLMHGTALHVGALPSLSVGGAVALLAKRTFDPGEVWELVESEAATILTIVGDAFARPLLTALVDGPRRDVSSLRLISSSGAMFSEEVKTRLLDRLAPDAMIMDFIGASEGSMGVSIATRERPAVTGRFTPDPGVIVLGDDGSPVVAGSGASGLIALPAVAESYFKDDAKTAATFQNINGRRYVIPGDHATVEADGSLTLLGRGSLCINTGGEKVFPEEVEEVLKAHPLIHDALVFGLPDERFGQRVAAVVSFTDPATGTVDELLADARTHLAGYKLPRTVQVVAVVPRTAVGKPDYPTARQLFDDSA